MFDRKTGLVCKARGNYERKEEPPFRNEEGGDIEWFLDNAYFVRYVKHFGVGFGNDIGTFF